MPSELPLTVPSALPSEAPSDDHVRQALDAVGAQVEAFRSAMAITADQVRGYVAGAEGAVSRVATELGVFAAGRVDAERFSLIVAEQAPAGGAWTAPAKRALEVLDDLQGRGNELFRARVESGGDLHAVVDHALGEAGRAFGAARVVELARSNRYRPDEHDSLLERFPFRRWSAGERALAPPLVIEVEGGDLLASGLAPYLDGAQKLVLVVEGEAPPAPLVRLITPGVLVVQAGDGSALGPLGAAPGPAVAALLPAGAAHFLHEPSAGEGPGRLEVVDLPKRASRRPLGSLSAFQQQEDLRLLAELAAQAAAGAAEPPAAVPGEAVSGASAPPAQAPVGGDGAAAPAGGAPAQSADVLAAWLLAQADLANLEASFEEDGR